MIVVTHYPPNCVLRVASLFSLRSYDGISITDVWTGITVHRWHITAPDNVSLDQQFLDQHWMSSDPNEVTYFRNKYIHMA